MEVLWIVLTGFSVIFMIINVFLAIIELVVTKTAKPPRPKSFAHIRFAQNQYQTIFMPALSALITGLFVSISASFFYNGLISERSEWDEEIGAAFFIAGAVALFVTLRSVIKGVEDPSALAREPIAIRAAAEEFSVNPRRGTVKPNVLDQQLREWVTYIDARSMNLAVDKTSDRLKKTLAQATEIRGLRSSILQSLGVYYAALLKFPFRFGWPLVSVAFFIIGLLGIIIERGGLSVTLSFRMTLVFMFGVASVVLYCGARGNRARFWYRVNRKAFEEAQQAIGQANTAQALVEKEEELLKQVVIRADSFLRQVQPAPNANDHVIFCLGKIRLSFVK